MAAYPTTQATPSPSVGFDLERAVDEFNRCKQKEAARNFNYYLLRQAVQGKFRWPRNWPQHIEKLKHNLCKPITERFSTFMMGKGFSFNVDRPNNIEYRVAAEKTEKILHRLFDLSRSGIQWEMGAKTGTQLGRTVFRVYKKGKAGSEHACFQFCQPDYFYGIASGDDALSDFSTVYYSYPIDIDEAKRVYGDKKYKTEADVGITARYDAMPERQSSEDWTSARDRRVPVLEAWSKDSYLLQVGSIVIFNGPNPNKWKDTGEGFIPFVVIENIRNAGEGVGESDIEQARELNEHYNYLLSRKAHMVGRWLNPTLVWEGAPQNYAATLAAVLTGGGAIPTRIGSRLSLLSHDKPNPSVTELEATLRQAILETAGMSELGLQGTVQGSINTGPALAAQYQPVLATVDKKRSSWEDGLRQLSAMLLQIQEDIGDSKVLGEAVVGATTKSKDAAPVPSADVPDGASAPEDGVLVALSGKDISGLRDITISWPGVLPKDDDTATRIEIEKFEKGLQSLYTTLEKLGEEYPDDEIARIRMENEDPSLKGQQVAEQMKAQAQVTTADARMAQAGAQVQQAQAPDPSAASDPYADTGSQDTGAPAANDGTGGLLRALARNTKPQLDISGDQPQIDSPQVPAY